MENINTLTLMLIVVAVTVAIMAAGLVLGKTRRDNPGNNLGETFANAWDKIRPIMSELFLNLFSIYQAEQDGFEGLLDFSVNYIYNKIQDADFLFAEEKALFSKDIIRTLLEPKLKELYIQKQRTEQKGFLEYEDYMFLYEDDMVENED